MLKFCIIFVLTSRCLFAEALLNPCSGLKGNIDDSCDHNYDCAGFAVVCNLGKCMCHQDYQETQDSPGFPKYCVKLPNLIGDTCTTSCKFPMFCQSGKCACIRSKVEDNQCFSDYQLLNECSRNFECTLPFTACISGRCQCVPGTLASGSVCIAQLNCPTGAKPQGSCIRKASNKQFIQNFANSGGNIDDCPDDHYCYTTDVSDSGVCCPIMCPLNMKPSLAYSCDPNANGNVCPDNTHYCARLAGQKFSSTVCCRKPCRDPTPVFVLGKCYPISYLGGSCTVNEQCDGGYGMRCSNNVCVCNDGFKPYSDSFISGENPPQTCVRDCVSPSTKTTLISYGGECFEKSSLQQQCAIQDQCPSGSICYRGLCTCNCTKGLVLKDGACITPVTTTKPPPVLLQEPAVANGQNNLLKIIGTLLGTNKGN